MIWDATVMVEMSKGAEPLILRKTHAEHLIEDAPEFMA